MSELNARSRVLPLLIALVTALLYLPGLSNSPIYLAQDEVVVAVNARSIATTGRDLYSDRVLPLYIHYNLPYVTKVGKQGVRSGWLPPGIFYAVALAVKVLPFSEATVRLPTAIVGILDVVLMFFIGRRLFRSDVLAALSALLLALTPSHFIHSRFALDYLYPVPFMLAWLWCFLIDFDDNRPWVLFAGTLCLGLGLYSYIAGALVMPLYLLLTLMALWRARRPPRVFFLAVAGFALPALLALPWLMAHPTMISDIFRKYDLNDGSQSGMLDSVRTFFTYHRLADQASLYWGFFNPRFLFFDGPMEPMFSTRQVGVFLLPVGAALIAGLITAFRSPIGTPALILLLGFFTAPLAATLVNINDAIYRALEMLPFAVLISVIGIQHLWSWVIKTPPRRLLTGAGALGVIAGAAYAAVVAATQSRLPGAALPLMAFGAALLGAAAIADRVRGGQLAVMVLLALVPVQFALFYYDYFHDYRRRTAIVYSGNIRGVFEEVIRRDESARIPAVYIGEIGGFGYGPLYWRFYLIKERHEELGARAIEAYYFNRDAVMKLPARSLVVTSAGDAATDAVIDGLVQRGEFKKSLVTEPDGTPTYQILERTPAP